jgi:DNA-binding response OmpR family regulator
MKTILLVEDDPFLIDIYCTKIKDSGFKVETVDTGERALDIIRKQNSPEAKKAEIWPDLLILDLVLPKVDGWQVLKEIKKDEKLKDMKIIIFTNLVQKLEVEKGLALGAAKYLIKAHYTPAELVEEIKKILQ